MCVPKKCQSTALLKNFFTLPYLLAFEIKVLIHMYTYTEDKIWVNSTLNDVLNIF